MDGTAAGGVIVEGEVGGQANRTPSAIGAQAGTEGDKK